MKRLPALLLIPCLAVATDTQTTSLDWLTGCWTTPDRRAQEVWVVDNDSLLLGFSVNLKDYKVGFYELMTIRRSSENTWVFTAHPAGQASTSFDSSQIGEHSITFTSAEHDYPQQISYRKEGRELLATISLLDGANPTNFRKLACE